ncbi:Microcystin-dependent protein [Chryseobacterium formosense]|uniref:phage tail protein n=1 Tax=Chryseobacterium formosense TaxID=236814 RepID=UPI0008ED63D4|nr:tail fiber protein [Chryseobacterium formosense]SFT68680.1 Microcystin-dependent protein [Chryseobacterium formosense]
MEGTIGEIRLFAANFAPKDWSYCNGTLIAIRANTALFSILGTTYGGDGQVTFGLPNLSGRSAIGAGQGPGLSYYALGETTGTNTKTLTISNIPPHTHTAGGNIVIPAFSDEGDSGSPANNILASKASMYTSQESDSTTKAIPLNIQVGATGGSIPINITQPSLGMNYIICMYGVFPSRS